MQERLATIHRNIPDCLVAGLINPGTGEVIASSTGSGRRLAELELAAAEVAEIFDGAHADVIERMPGEEPQPIREYILISRGAVQMFQRCRVSPELMLVTITRASGNLGATIARSRQWLVDLEEAA